MKITKIGLLVTALFAQLSLADTYTCYSRYGSPTSELAIPCGEAQKIEINEATLKKIVRLTAKCDETHQIFAYIQGTAKSHRMDFTLQKIANGSVESIATAWTQVSPSKVYSVGINSKGIGFAEISCLHK